MIKLVALLCLVMLVLFVLSALLWILMYKLGSRPVGMYDGKIVWKFKQKADKESAQGES